MDKGRFEIVLPKAVPPKTAQRHASDVEEMSELKKRVAQFLESTAHAPPAQPILEGEDLPDDDAAEDEDSSAEAHAVIEMNLLLGVLEAREKPKDILIPSAATLAALERHEQEQAEAMLGMVDGLRLKHGEVQEEDSAPRHHHRPVFFFF